MITFYTVKIDNGLPYEDNYVSVDYFQTYHEAYEYASDVIAGGEFADDNNNYMKTMFICKTSFTNTTDFNEICLSRYFAKENSPYCWQHGLDFIPDNIYSSDLINQPDNIDVMYDKFYEYSREVITPQTSLYSIYNILEKRNNEYLEEEKAYKKFCKHSKRHYIGQELARITGIVTSIALSEEAGKYYCKYMDSLVKELEELV